jgi:long-chain acyl-CoA synthetase
MTDTALQSARTISRAAASAAERYGTRPALRYLSGGAWHTDTFAEVSDAVDNIAYGLVNRGIELGDRVCLLANTRREWTLVSLAISRAGAVVVPMYPTSSPEECAWVASNSGARAIICEDAAQVAKITDVRDELDQLEWIASIEPAGGTLSLDSLRADGSGDRSELERRCRQVRPDDPYTIIYTSGTTGLPKGVMLTHGNAASVSHMVEEIGFINHGEVTYLFLPLAHCFALTVQLASFPVGTEIVYFGGNIANLVAEMQATRPTYLPSVPRVFEKIYTLVTSAFDDPQKLAHVVEVGVTVREMRERGETVPRSMQFTFDRADADLYRNVRAVFGGRLDKAVCGAAPIAPEILRFFYACGVPVLEGWGMTETVALGAINTHGHIRFGTVGRALPGIEFRIASDGEIFTRGPNVFGEYWRDPDATREALDDGWLATGDLGSLDADGYLSITGRKKDIIITAGGKNLTPANLENDLKQSRWISQAVMYGDRRPYPVALITLDPEQIVPWAAVRSLPQDMPALVRSDEVIELIQSELDRVNARYARVEQIKKFALLDRDLSHEDGELTPTLKVRRNIVYERYADVLDALYG